MSLLSAISKNDRIFMLAYDQGIEHGPTDFNDRNYHPNHIFKIALDGGATCVAMGYGLAKKFYTPELAKKMPLVLKLNGKTNLYSKNTRSAQISYISDAKRLGAVAIGFTIFPGQPGEHEQYEQFAQIRREAESAGIATIIWSYARGPEIENDYDKDVVAHAARTAAELGADAVKVKHPGMDNIRWVANCAAGTKLLLSGTGGFSEDDNKYIDEIVQTLNHGTAGLAVGRRIWQADNAVDLSLKVSKAMFG